MKPSIIFMGTPDFAVPALKSLMDNHFDTKLVVTQPDRPSGRGQKLTPPPIKTLATELGIEVFQPRSLKSDPDAAEKILSTPCDFIVVVAFGQILPKKILDHPKIAPLNIHASLLPAYRGAAPIQRALMEGEEKTGVTIQWMIEALDQGDILYQLPFAISESDTSGSLHDALKVLGSQALIETLKLFEANRIARRSQDARVGSYAAKLEKSEAFISFDQAASLVHRNIMGLNPFPIARCHLAGKILRVYKSHFVGRYTDAAPGTIIDTSDGEIIVACRQGCIGITEVQLENRNRISAREFLRGHPIPDGLILGAQV